MKKMKTTMLFLGAFLSLALVAQEKSAADFSLMGDDQKMHGLKEHQGKHIVLEWYNKGCPFVKKHYGSGNMQKLQAKYVSRGVVWYSIISSAEGKQGYLSDAELKLEKSAQKSAQTAILKDGDGKVGKLYGAKTTPQMVVINPKGEIIYEGAIDDKASTDEKDIASSTNYVATVLNRSLKGEKVAYSRTESYGCGVKYQD